MKKFISLMLLFAMASFSWAQDVEEEEEEEEEVVEVVKPKAVKAAKKAGNSKMGLQVGYDGTDKMVGVVYDMGTGLRLLVGLDFLQYTGANEAGEAVTKNVIGLGLGGEYELGKALLPYGLGAHLDFYNEEMPDVFDGGMFKGMIFTPYFYTEAEIVKNLTFGVNAGVFYAKPDGGDAAIGLSTAGKLNFYFM